MSENLDATTAGKPQGKGMAVTGFILSLVTLVFNTLVFGIAVVAGSAGFWYFWLILNIVALVLCIMGMMKLGKTGGKKGLAIAGMVIGIVGTIWAIVLTMGLSIALSERNDLGNAFQRELNKTNIDMNR